MFAATAPVDRDAVRMSASLSSFLSFRIPSFFWRGCVVVVGLAGVLW